MGTESIMKLLLDPDYDVYKHQIELHDQILVIRNLVSSEEYQNYKLIVKQYLLRLRVLSRWLHYGASALFYEISMEQDKEWKSKGYIGVDGKLWLIPKDARI